MLIRRDKTGSLSQTVGIKGRIYGTWEIVMDLTGNGTLGMPPDAAILLASAFGQDGVAAPTTAISAVATVSSQAVATVASVANMVNGQTWQISGVTQTAGSGWANGPYVINVLSPTTIGLVGSPATGTYTVSSAAATNPGVVYTLSDNPYTFDLWSFRNIPGASSPGPEQRVAGSCVTTSLEITFGGDFSTLTARGDCLCVMDNVYFAASPGPTTPEKGGLGSYPTEPTAPVTNGYPAPGFVGVAIMDLNQIYEIKTGTLTIGTGRKLIRDSFGSYTPTGIESDVRAVSLMIVADDSDSTWLADLKTKSKEKIPISYSITVGNVSGDEFVFSASNLVLEPPAITEQALRYQARFPTSMSYSSSYTAKDEISMVAQ